MVRSFTRRNAVQAFGTVAVSGLLAGCGEPDNPGPKIVELTDDPIFNPEFITIDAGQTVRWVNESSLDHTVTGDSTRITVEDQYFASGGYDSEEDAREAFPPGGVLKPGDTFEHTFEVSGDFGYLCLNHEEQGMTGTVHVPGGELF